MGFPEQRDQMVIETNQRLVELSQATHGLPLIYFTNGEF
jgi:hypothetical protein